MHDTHVDRPAIEVPFEYTLAERDAIRADLLARKEELGVGFQNLAYAMSRTVRAYRRSVLYPDDTCLPDPVTLCHRAVRNFVAGRMSAVPTLAIIDAYLKIIAMHRSGSPEPIEG